MYECNIRVRSFLPMIERAAWRTGPPVRGLSPGRSSGELPPLVLSGGF